MPMMDLTYPAGALSAEAKATLAEDLTTVLLRAERAPDTDFFRQITWLFVHELPAEDALAAGAPAPIFRLQVTVPQGALSERRKDELVREATHVLRKATGVGEADALRLWVVIGEVPDGNWGAGGTVVRFDQLRQAAAAERDGAGATSVVGGAA